MASTKIKALMASYAPSNPDYDMYLPIWQTIDDCIAGEDTIKMNGEKYLHKTTGMAADLQYGNVAYANYLYKANYPNYPLDYMLQLNGLLWQREPQISVPDEMDKEFLPAPAFASNKSFLDVYHDTSDCVLKYARHGILLDVPNNSEKRINTYPVMVQYNAYQIIHWGTTTYKGQEVVKFVLLDESSYSYENDSLSPVLQRRYRFLGLKTKDENGFDIDTPVYYSYTKEGSLGSAIFDPPFDPSMPEFEYRDAVITYPNINGVFMDEIPFFCFGAVSMNIAPEAPLIYPLCKASLAIYRTDADYREYLYKQGFAILFGTGFEYDSDIYVGTQKAIMVTSSEARLQYVNTDGVGLSEYRASLENLHKNAVAIGINLFKSSGDETGQSVLRHTSLKTASLKSISKTMAYGFTMVCKAAARWRGLPKEDIDTINIIPNLEFSAAGGDTTSLMNMYGVYSGSADVITPFDMYSWLRKNDFTTYNTFEEWKKEVDSFAKIKQEIRSKELQAIPQIPNKTENQVEVPAPALDNKAKM